MVELKTEAELAVVREAGRMVARVHDAVRARAAVGVTLRELDDLARKILADAGAEPVFLGYQPRFATTPFPGVICTSVNDAALHGIPDGYRLRDGDVLSVDCGAEIDGWVADAATTFIVGTPDPDDGRLIESTRRALDAAINTAVVDARLGDVSYAIGEVARADGYGINTDYGGHGVGRQMHEEPSVPNDGRPGRGMRLRPGLVIAIEPWFMSGGDSSYYVDDDGWTLRTGDGSRAAHMEHTVAITPDGPRVLTLP
ncbi:MAG: type I methionyl aminopeptidase [Propionibacteriales bacterium]|nr:type I methionyl aminopeptidase [Propionibacteriales bacterium]